MLNSLNKPKPINRGTVSGNQTTKPRVLGKAAADQLQAKKKAAYEKRMNAAAPPVQLTPAQAAHKKMVDAGSPKGTMSGGNHPGFKMDKREMDGTLNTKSKFVDKFGPKVSAARQQMKKDHFTKEAASQAGKALKWEKKPGKEPFSNSTKYREFVDKAKKHGISDKEINKFMANRVLKRKSKSRELAKDHLKK